MRMQHVKPLHFYGSAVYFVIYSVLAIVKQNTQLFEVFLHYISVQIMSSFLPFHLAGGRVIVTSSVWCRKDSSRIPIPFPPKQEASFISAATWVKFLARQSALAYHYTWQLVLSSALKVIVVKKKGLCLIFVGFRIRIQML